MPYELITRLLGFPGFHIADIEMQGRSVVMTIDRDQTTFRCGSCTEG